MNPPGEQSRKKASINKEGKEASGEKAGGGKAMHLCAAKCKPRGECRQKGVGNPFFIQGNTAQFTAEALSVASLADFPATVTKMLANTQSIREHSCLTCQKICRRDSKLRIVRCCLISNNSNTPPFNVQYGPFSLLFADLLLVCMRNTMHCLLFIASPVPTASAAAGMKAKTEASPRKYTGRPRAGRAARPKAL